MAGIGEFRTCHLLLLDTLHPVLSKRRIPAMITPNGYQGAVLHI